MGNGNCQSQQRRGPSGFRILILDGSEESYTNVEELEGGLDLYSLFQEMVSSLVDSPRFDLGSAHYLYDISRKLSPTNKQSIMRKDELVRKGYSASQIGGIISLDDAVRTMLSKETSLLDKDLVLQTVHYSTRDLVDALLTHLCQPTIYNFYNRYSQALVALPVPNWHFWLLPGAVQRRYSFAYFPAETETQLVEGFEKQVREKKPRVLLLVNPSNPLGYTISVSAAQRINEIALREGIDIVIDDVLRGVQPIGSRQSIGEHFTQPYIIEGFSKRFGDEYFGKSAYMLSPSRRLVLNHPNGHSCLCGELFQAVYDDCSEDAIQQLEQRNRVFDQTIRLQVPDLHVTRPSSSHLTSLVHLPSDMCFSALDFAQEASFRGVQIAPLEVYYPDDYNGPKNGRSLFRITVGRMDVRDIYSAASALGYEIFKLRG